MSKKLKLIRFFIEFIFFKIFHCLIKLAPHSLLKIASRCWGRLVFAIFRKLITANIKVAFPEKTATEVKRIGKASCFNMVFNMLEFVWASGNDRRIEKIYCATAASQAILEEAKKNNTRIIFVNPHLGSWEASGLIAPHFGNIKMAAIAKPLRNPFLNKLLNQQSREKEHGLKIIFAKGAIKAATKALRSGYCIGTLIDQNTRIRNGGTFVKFFGLPVPSSKAPVLLARFCRGNDLDTKIVYAHSLRNKDGKVQADVQLLKKDFAEYDSDKEIIQELIHYAERAIIEHPEQYLWLYHRFRYIPRQCPQELKEKFPYYASEAPPKFYSKVKSPAINDLIAN